MSNTHYKPIEDYGVIGDLHTVALVGKDGSIDWCCLPHFDSPSIFAGLLDYQKGGYFKIAPTRKTQVRQLYMPETCVLLTRFLCPDGVGELIDFMPIYQGEQIVEHKHQIVRIVRVVRGSVEFKMECHPAFDYGRVKHKTKMTPKGVVFSTGKEAIGLMSDISFNPAGEGVEAVFTLRAGEETSVVLNQIERGGGDRVLVSTENPNETLTKTINYWRQWLSGCRYQGRWRELVRRSAMTLKLLTFAPTGAIVAAPTTSLPEEIGGVRNWDYRYTWIRDAAFTVHAFLRLGLTNEAEQFMDWIFSRAIENEKDGSLQVMYRIDGGHDTTESELNHLEGYCKSGPVRIGNAAYKQLQMDIYGELMDAVYLSNKYGTPIDYDLWTHLRRLVNYVCKNWTLKDEGIWEVRGGKQDFVYSKLMGWVTLDRGIRLAEKRGFPADREKWYKTRDKIYEEIMEKGWNEKKKSFVQHYKTDALDASNLIIPLTHFISGKDPRMVSTLDATLRELSADHLIYRYRIGDAADDGLTGGEGTFSMCTFWLVECLTNAGRLEEARLVFEKMLSYSNHLGLYSEEIGSSGEALGNFPQALTHLSLINAAYNLNEALDRQSAG